jgi:hypothetical protein
LTLRLKGNAHQSDCSAAQNDTEPMLANFVNNAPASVSTLQHFARVGGLAVLSHHLQLHLPFSHLLST